MHQEEEEAEAEANEAGGEKYDDGKDYQGSCL